ncbi:MAG: hypothetical protein QGI49_01720 [SAR202 cluster bacterium]|nr:hypothetical protein [SAR202 cluster bacterium]
MSDISPDRNIGTDRQLFVDEFWIDEASNVERRLHEPVRREIAIESNGTWDLMPSAGKFMWDGNRYRAWYRTEHDSELVLKRSGFGTAYVESDDGITWSRPSLGLFEANGSKDNNLVWMGPGANMVPFHDPNPDVPDDERYKAVVRTKDLLALVSPDGVNWRLLQDEPIMTDGPFDTVNVVFWDSSREEYVVYTRGVAGEATQTKSKKDISIWKDSYRWIRRATSSDFINWSPLELIDTGDTIDEDFYTNACIQYERAPGTYLMFPSRYVVERSPDPEWTYGHGVNDIVFMSSRDGLHFDRSMRDAFIRPGTDQNNWHDRGVYIEPGILMTSPTEMSLYGMENSHLASQRIRRYSLRTDGFVSVNADYTGGEFLTKPLIFEGSELELNYSTSAVGSVQVEIQDAEGNTMSGYGLADCPEKFGDEIEGVMNWNAGSSVGELAGRSVRLRVVLKDADLYAFRFRKR